MATTSKPAEAEIDLRFLHDNEALDLECWRIRFIFSYNSCVPYELHYEAHSSIFQWLRPFQLAWRELGKKDKKGSGHMTF